MKRLALVVLAALSLAACKLDATVAVVVEPDGSGSVSITLVADKELVDQAPGLADDLRFDDAIAAGWTADTPESTADGGLQVVISRPFATVEEATALLQSVNSTNGPLHDVVLSRVVTDDDVTTNLTGTLRVDGGIDAFADPDLLAVIGGTPYADNIANTGLTPAQVVSFTLTADLPGEAASNASGVATGVGDDQVLTWSVPIDGTTADLSTVAVIAQGRPSSIWGTVAKVALFALVVWCVLAAGFILFVAKARRERALRRGEMRPPPRYR